MAPPYIKCVGSGGPYRFVNLLSSKPANSHCVNQMIAKRKGRSVIYTGVRDGATEIGMKYTTILVVDDSVTIRAMLEVLLEREPSLRIVGIAGNAQETFALIRETDPDVVTLDIAMPGMDGMAVLDRIMKREPRPVIMLSSLMREGSPLRAEAAERGAAGCFNKSRMVQHADELIQMIRDVAYQRGDRPDMLRFAEVPLNR